VQGSCSFELCAVCSVQCVSVQLLELELDGGPRTRSVLACYNIKKARFLHYALRHHYYSLKHAAAVAASRIPVHQRICLRRRRRFDVHRERVYFRQANLP
jgi:Zn-finger nucleic acid-binding protein